MAAAAAVTEANSLAQTKNPQDKKKLPKALGALKEEKLAAKQELKALGNILGHVGFSLDQIWGSCPLAPVNGDGEMRILHTVDNMSIAFVIDSSGACRWDSLADDSEHVRLVMGADQGSPLYSCYQYLAGHGASITLIRDELHKLHAHQGRATSCSPIVKRMTMLSGWLFRAKKSPWGTCAFASTLKEAGERYLQVAEKDDVLMELFSRDILKENGLPCTTDASLNFARVVEILGKTIKYNSESFSWSRWCSWAHTAAKFQMTCTLLLILWSSMEAMLGFVVIEPEEQSVKSNNSTSPPQTPNPKPKTPNPKPRTHGPRLPAGWEKPFSDPAIWCFIEPELRQNRGHVCEGLAA
ncbi:unnamed protein product [Symbiodinium sp. CCMP2592]|nr:unnamed protein product [Symbiodinium sp. CCMP2592]CAE7593526.1 unnamed protein product [Symbiodinium sp. CCMP2592]